MENFGYNILSACKMEYRKENVWKLKNVPIITKIDDKCRIKISLAKFHLNHTLYKYSHLQKVELKFFDTIFSDIEDIPTFQVQKSFYVRDLYTDI